MTGSRIVGWEASLQFLGRVHRTIVKGIIMENIDTGVDKLVRIIEKERKVALDVAAKELGVDVAVVQEWADFLEQEGLIDVQYSLSKVFLVEKRLSKVEVEKKSKEYDNKREAFTRKVDATLKQLETETADFETIKTQYYALKDQIGDQIDAVKEEIEQLRHYEDLKKSIDHDILKQRVDYQKTLDEVHLRVTAEEKRFQKILEDITTENARVQSETAEFVDIRREQSDLQKRIEALQEIMRSIATRLNTQSAAVKGHEERLLRLRELSGKLQIEITERKAKEIDPLLKISKDQEARIMRIQDDIVAKIKSNRDSLQSFSGQSEEIAKRFEGFFERRVKTESTLKELEKSKAEMKEELSDLIRKAKAFDIAAKGADTNEHIKELESKFKKFDEKRGAFAHQLEKLKSLILGTHEVIDVNSPPQELPALPEHKGAGKDASKAKKSAGKNVAASKSPSAKKPAKSAKK